METVRGIGYLIGSMIAIVVVSPLVAVYFVIRMLGGCRDTYES